ncbi:MAG: thiamine-phosphate kinase [Thiohalocapsa sp.]|jgi:thiamine-monophosphate kinase|uniref:thiamine-phosphate kinase n=1 Tax=Thiohalocapsa sp. TaxID=2497641 RepID=UPI0025ED0748|nr:thiamine-phosphate kinase [Thiohalocapsa sp.]MCG6942566.1 thiamine-phosphate kinase [Thiohalocapsa sp.]
MSEFDLIRRHLTGVGTARDDVLVDVGDDCALLRVPAGRELAVGIDTLVAGVHFLPDCDPEALGWKALAVNLSDLAAVGAEPAWATLALTMPEPDEAWLAAFVRGFGALAAAEDVRLVGGDLTRGPLTVTVQAHGFVPADHVLRRAGARPGDLICVSGALGDAGLALRHLTQGEPLDEYLRGRLDRPSPRVALGEVLRGLATSAIDLSDGLISDLGHVLAASGCGARVELERLPLADQVAAAVAVDEDWSLPLASGDDYELCFTLPPAALGQLPVLAAAAGCPLTTIGEIVAGQGLRLVRADGSGWNATGGGYDHFVAS